MRRTLPLLTLALILYSSIMLVSGCNGSDEHIAKRERQGRVIDPQTTLAVLDQGQEVTRVRVALAQTEAERNTGLMDVHTMDADAGMLFLFDDEQPRSFWMVNTPLSLDIIFANSDREIVRIRQNTTPFSDRRITSEVPAKYVLEVHAGYAREHDLREGMILQWD